MFSWFNAVHPNRYVGKEKEGARKGCCYRMKDGTVVLLVSTGSNSHSKTPELIDYLYDDREIAVVESALQSGVNDPLELISEFREREKQEEEEFGNYVENLLSQPFLKSEIQNHAIQWLKSKIRIEQFQKAEREATQVIARYAFNLFKTDPERKDYFLAGPTAKVRIRIFTLDKIQNSQAA